MNRFCIVVVLSISFIFLVLGATLLIKQAILLKEMQTFNADLEKKTQQIIENQKQWEEAGRLIRFEQEMRNIKWEIVK